MKKPDEIMAEQLLKGGKMLASSCKSCGNPLFEVKGNTTCVICGLREDTDPGVTGNPRTSSDTMGLAGQKNHPPDSLCARASVEAAITALSRRAEEAPNPADALVLMQAVECGARALPYLQG